MQFKLFLFSLFLSLALVALLKKISEKFDFAIDTFDGRVLKIHTKKTSLLGGAGFALIFLAVFYFIQGKLQGPSLQFWAIAIGAIIIFLLGFFDDIKWKGSESNQKKKFIFLILSVFMATIVLRIGEIGFDFIPIIWVSTVLSFIYIFGAINSVNYQDGIDGLAGGLVLISLAGFAVLGFVTGNVFALNISVILLGVLLGFMFFNFPPAKIFMGDSGAYFLGFILSVLAMLFCKPYDIFSVLGPIFIIGIPVLDGIYTNFRRIKKRQSLFSGDRLYYYDLLAQKYSVKKVLAISYFAQISLVVLGILLYYLNYEL